MHLVAFMGAICGEGRGNWEVRFIMRTFEGVRVIDFTQAVAGPFATYQLALQGADVVKVEQPGAGDQGRQMYRLDADFQKLGYSAIFLCGNAGKRSLTLDLKHPDARAVVHRLVRDADVVIENFKAGTMDRMGFGWNDLKQLNPKLVYCSISGFGQTGPRAAAAAYDPTIQAASGVMAVNGVPETGPMRVGAIICDMSSSITAAFAIAGALFKRERAGVGGHLDLSMQDVAAAFMSPNLLQAAYGFEPDLMGNKSLSGNPMATAFPTKAGVLLLIPATDAQCAKIWPVVGRPEFSDDPRFTTLDARLANHADCTAALMAGLASETAADWELRFAEAGVPAAAVLTLPEVLEDRQLAHRGTIQTMKSPADDRDLIHTRTPFKISGEETGPDCPPPLVGADTDAVLGELGYGADEIVALREASVV
jgi:crotonobetainyl-CoA:carnitine CoA-transferase CaiB-like acyl-CoA transferase